jgi:hypothetical protein
MFSVLSRKDEEVMAKLVYLAGGERQLEEAMRHVTNGHGGRVDEQKLLNHLITRRRIARERTGGLQKAG